MQHALTQTESIEAKKQELTREGFNKFHNFK